MEALVHNCNLSKMKLKSLRISTPKEWVEAYNAVTAIWAAGHAHTCKIPLLNPMRANYSSVRGDRKPNYSFTWMVRCLLLTHRWKQQSLRKVSDVRLREFKSTFPDQKDMFRKLHHPVTN